MTDALRTFLESYHSGNETHAHHFLGCHPETRDGVDGFVFRVWAPNAQAVHVVGDFNFWNPEDLSMEKISQGIWEAWSPHAKEGNSYKYLIHHWNGRSVYKADPVGFRTCRRRIPPASFLCATTLSGTTACGLPGQPAALLWKPR